MKREFLIFVFAPQMRGMVTNIIQQYEMVAGWHGRNRPERRHANAPLPFLHCSLVACALVSVCHNVFWPGGYMQDNSNTQ